MTRITLQRGLLLLALTGILLSGAQESTSESSPAETVPPHWDEPGGVSAEKGGDEASRKSDEPPPTEAVESTTVGHSDGPSRDDLLPRDAEVGTSTENDPPTSHVTEGGKDQSTPSSSSDDPSTVPSVDSRSSNGVGRDEVGTVVEGGSNDTEEVTPPLTRTEGEDGNSTGSPSSSLPSRLDVHFTVGLSSSLPFRLDVHSTGGPSSSLPSRLDVHSEPLVSDATSPALFSEDSIHPRTATVPDTSTEPPESPDPSEPSPGVTFDPDGMTHHSPQDPDAVTFHVDPFSLLEERERESNGISTNRTDGPDREELSGALPVGRDQVGTVEGSSNATEEIASTLPSSDDESEEMMNDSPQFRPIQKTTKGSEDLSHTPELDPSSEQSEFRPITAPSPPATGSSAPAAAANATEEATSSIAGLSVKTSVSVSLPLSKSVDVTVLPNVTGMLPFPIHLDSKESAVQTSAASTDAPGTTTPGGLRIRKPKPKVGGGTEGPRTRKPFLAPPPRASTTLGPSVSIFLKSRTRGASITSSTTSRPFPTLRVNQAPGGPRGTRGPELVSSVEPTTTTVATTTETEEPFSDEGPFTGATVGPAVGDDDITLQKVAGCVTVENGLRWHEQLNNRHSPLYRERAAYVQIQLERLFRTSPIASKVWKIQMDGFSGRRESRSVVIDFFLYLIKSRNDVSAHQLTLVFHDRLLNNTFSRFTLDPARTTFEFLNEEPMRPPTEAPESTDEDPVLPQWAIAVIVVGAASLIFILLFAVVAILGRHHMRRRYSSKLTDEDTDRPGDWETKMAAAYENLAADTIYDAEDLHSDTYRKSYLVD